jgi:dimethylamine/trimethylamine dehydrogenase
MRLLGQLRQADVSLADAHDLIKPVSQCVFTGRERTIRTDAVVLVTARLPVDSSTESSSGRARRSAEIGLRTIKAVGGCRSPGTIAAAVREGRHYAEELDEPGDRGDTVPFRREVTELASD